MAYEEYEQNEEILEDDDALEEEEQEELEDETLNEEEHEDVEDENPEDVSYEDTQEEEEKTFSQADVDRIINRKFGKVRRETEAEKEQYNELIHTLKSGMKFEGEDVSIGELNKKLREAFEEQDVTIPEYHRGLSKHEQEVLAKDRANEVLEGGIEDVAEEYQRLRDKDRLSYSEQIQFKTYERELAIFQAKDELEKQGKDSNVLESEDFIKFASKYKADISLSEIYSDYERYTTNPEIENKPRPAGSVRSKKQSNKIKNHYSPDEAREFTTEELLKNPKLLDAINKSSEEW
ncbi:hypothetical protein [Anaerofustis stercorihominis]|uniref:DUF4355 domain-containing protein n=1 Tax=Anaerofustis stercorihominis TaxID=214853 RepID=A0A3E3DX20_9FIRM|nr:hypothetical protein [Anaerofustis stercorihominis]RGD73821.1 hypothetical protein DW687_08575 [Anaerofustis stercorihominis]